MNLKKSYQIKQNKKCHCYFNKHTLFIETIYYFLNNVLNNKIVAN